MAADLAAVIEQLDRRDITLVGYSMGSAEVTRYVSRYGSERVSRVVLVSPVPPAPVSGAMFDAFITALKQDRPAFIAGGISASSVRIRWSLPRWQLRVYEGAPHGIVLTHRQRFTNDLFAFLGTGG